MKKEAGIQIREKIKFKKKLEEGDFFEMNKI